MHSMQIVEWGKPLEPRDRSTPKPQGTEVLLGLTQLGGGSGGDAFLAPRTTEFQYPGVR